MPSEAEFRQLKQEFDRLKILFDTLARNFNDVWPPRQKRATTNSASAELVAIATDGGSGTAPANFTYGFTTADGVTHAAVPVDNARNDVDLLAGGWGIYKVDPDGTERLVVLDETIDFATCV